MSQISIRILCLLECVLSLTAVRYGDYSIVRMPQYSERHEDSAHSPELDEYNDKSPDASARLDYKYEEESQGTSDDLPLQDIVDESIWDKPVKKKIKSSIVHRDPNHDVHRYTSDETESELKSGKRFVMRKSELRKINKSQRHLKHNSRDQDDDIDSVDNKSDYAHKEDEEIIDDFDAKDYRFRTIRHRKPRRKPRARTHHQSKRRGSNNDIKFQQEEEDTRTVKEKFRTKNSRGLYGIFHREYIDGNNNSNYDYNDYYDMKRINLMKNRLPAFLRPTTVKTTKAKGSNNPEYWLNQRADTSAEYDVSASIDTTATSSVMSTMPAFMRTKFSTKTTSEIKSALRNSSEMLLGEKSRLSILKKAQKKNNLQIISSVSKPPVLMQVTRKMQTVIVVEPRSSETAIRTQEQLKDSPELLQRVRRHMRHKLVADARSIHDITDNWDEIICDYVDVASLKTDESSYIEINIYIKILILLLVIVNF